MIDAVAEIRRALAGRVPLIGFAGSPYTLACYMVEGGASDDFRTIKTMLYSGAGDLLHRILEVNAQAVALYLNAQIEAGAQAVMIFDTWGGNLSHAAYREFSLAYLAAQSSPEVKREHDGRARAARSSSPRAAATVAGVDRRAAAATASAWTGPWTSPRRAARIGERVALQGNLDPAVLFSSPQVIREETKKVLASFGAGSGHVFNLGHGISQFTPPEHVSALVDAVHELSRAYHEGALTGFCGAGVRRHLCTAPP